jgi:hypothetical protein
MVVENPLLSGAVIAAGLVAAANIANMLLKPWTEKRSNQINAARLEIEQDQAHRKGDTELFDLEEKRREELRKEVYREQTRAEKAEQRALDAERQLILWQGRCEFHGRKCQIAPGGSAPVLPASDELIQLNPLPVQPGPAFITPKE